MTAPAKWIARLVNEVSKHMFCFEGLNTAVQCHVFHNRDVSDEWEITVFGEPNRFGGRLARHSIDRCFSIDAMALMMLLEDVESCQWQTSNVDGTDELGPHLSIVGGFQGHRVWLRVLARAPEKLRTKISVESSIQQSDD